MADADASSYIGRWVTTDNDARRSCCPRPVRGGPWHHGAGLHRDIVDGVLHHVGMRLRRAEDRSPGVS
ncbi:hypothetical protein ACFYZ5_39655 [Streptomyces chartreusis]|uniref:hypothetical protein n=1 Tax=Streptomyces chartreusis TaxID=1969 RepID=UPI0036C2FBAC